MRWRKVSVKYGFIFLIIFIGIYALFGRAFFQSRKRDLFDQANEEIKQVVVILHEYVTEHEEYILERDNGFHQASVNDLEIIFLSDAFSDLEQHWAVDFSKSFELSDQIYQQEIKHQEQQLLTAGIRSDQFSLVIYSTTSNVTAQLRQLKWLLIITATFFIVIFILFIQLLSRRISIPVKRMKESTHQMIAGDFSIKLPMKTYDEMGELAMAFNRMGRQLGQQISILLQEKEILFNVIGSMKDGVMTLNRDGVMIVSNEQAKQFIADLNYEQNAGGMEGLPDPFNHFFQSVISKRTSENFQMNIQGRDWDVVITPLSKEKDRQGAVAIVRDITEKVQLDELRETFIGNVSHELRTPISLVQGYSEAIIDGLMDTVEDQRELAKVIQSEAERMGRLVNDLLDLTRLKSGHIELNIESHLVEPFIQKINHKFSNRLKEFKITFDYTIAQALTYASFDYDRVDQVMTNLIDNAIKHTPENGMITLAVNKEKDLITFTLTDTGVGISSNDLPFVFERFYMVDKSRTKINRRSKGTGLGLAIVKQIIDAHQGTIHAQSIEGEGTTFKFTLPTYNS